MEPMIATLLCIFVYREPISVTSAAGVLCVLAAVTLLNLRQRSTAR